MSTRQTVPIRADAEKDGYSLPAWIYDSAEFLALELEHIFATSWQIVCHGCDVPNAGDYQTFELLGERIFAMRQADDSIRAFHNVCRHRAARLLDRTSGNCPGRIVCPYHAWTYETSGELA